MRRYEIARGTASRVIDGDILRSTTIARSGLPPSRCRRPARQRRGVPRPEATLDALIGGDTVALRKAEFAADRYGRLLAYVYAVRDGEEIFAQGEMLASGFARVGDRVGSRACATYLLGRESAARRDKLGLWGNSYYQVLDAETPADVLAQRGRFALVEGRVVSVRESGATIYVNFGQRWSEEFSRYDPETKSAQFCCGGP